MSLVRRFAGLAAHAHFLDERVAAMVPIGELMVAASAKMLYNAVRKGYGDHVLPELAQATQDDRVAHGFTANDPLLRSGALLRDSTEVEVGDNFAAVHSAEPIAGFHEWGYFNVRAGHSVPPRPVYRLALEEAAPGIARMIEANVGMQLGFSSEALESDLDTQTATYALNVAEKE